MCARFGAADPSALGKQIAVLFQGALVMAQVCRNSDPFASATLAVGTLLDNAARAGRA